MNRHTNKCSDMEQNPNSDFDIINLMIDSISGEYKLLYENVE